MRRRKEQESSLSSYSGAVAASMYFSSRAEAVQLYNLVLSRPSLGYLQDPRLLSYPLVWPNSHFENGKKSAIYLGYKLGRMGQKLAGYCVWCLKSKKRKRKKEKEIESGRSDQ